MPRNPSSGTRYLLKRRRPGVSLAQTVWSGRYRGQEVELATWAGVPVEKDAKAAKAQAITILRRFLTAVDEQTFDPAGERAMGSTTQTLAMFIQEWRTHYAEAQELSMVSLGPMLDVLANGTLGSLSLNDLAGDSERIEKWLNGTGKSRKWKARTWNLYHNLLNRLFTQATKWTVGGKPRMAVNPMARVSRKRKVVQPEHFKRRHLVEDIEDRLFAACDLLDVPPKSHGKLDQARADAIRARLTAGESGAALARAYGVSATIISQIKNFDIWNPGRVLTRGTEMKRRLIGAFDGGLRAGEMLKTKIEHVNWKPVRLDDGSEVYEMVLPPSVTKGGKTSGKNEVVYAGTARFKHMLEARRFQLKNNLPSQTYIFGTEDGNQQQGFRKTWRQLFQLAGLEWGRSQGIVWHTIRHEYISRMAEQTKDPVLTQEMARHKDLETTQGYFHTRVSKRIAAAVGLERSKAGLER